MFGIRQLSPTEVSNYCSNNSNSTLPITNANVNFTANYYVRAYTSACYYLDQNSYWQTSNLVVCFLYYYVSFFFVKLKFIFKVGPQTNEDQTECLTNHLTTFAGGWIVLPAPINWNYVFANLSFVQNLTIYITMIIILILYIIIMIYARYKDKKDIEKVKIKIC
jgi:Kef-type K+ transport system membrane component KefB